MRWCLFCSGVPAPDRIFILETEVESGAKWADGSVEGVNQNIICAKRECAPQRKERMEKGIASARERRRGSESAKRTKGSLV